MVGQYITASFLRCWLRSFGWSTIAITSLPYIRPTTCVLRRLLSYMLETISTGRKESFHLSAPPLFLSFCLISSCVSMRTQCVDTFFKPILFFFRHTCTAQSLSRMQITRSCVRSLTGWDRLVGSPVPRPPRCPVLYTCRKVAICVFLPPPPPRSVLPSPLIASVRNPFSCERP